MQKRLIPFIFLLVSLVLILTVYAIHDFWKIQNQGKVIAVGVGIYKDSECLNPLTFIAWGTVYPNSKKTYNAWILNEGNANITLEMYVQNFTPQEIEAYFNVTWSYDGSVIEPKQIIPVFFILQVGNYDLNYTSFSFDILVMANES